MRQRSNTEKHHEFEGAVQSMLHDPTLAITTQIIWSEQRILFWMLLSAAVILAFNAPLIVSALFATLAVLQLLTGIKYFQQLAEYNRRKASTTTSTDESASGT